MNDGKGTLRQDSERHSLGFERLLIHPPEKVWRALTEDDELAVWFPARIEGSREAGASLRFVSPPKPGQVPADTDEEGLTMTGEMLVVDPPRVLEYLWEGDVLRWVLDPHSDGTLLTFTHTFDDEGRAARDASGWDMCLASLEARLAGLKAEPFTAERHAVLFAHYAEEFGPAAAKHQTPEM
jgi:uncharacterized protein YndB with AHSA1/START domain